MGQQEPFVVEEPVDAHPEKEAREEESVPATAGVKNAFAVIEKALDVKPEDLKPGPIVPLESPAEVVGGYKTAAEAFRNIHNFLAGPEWDLEVLKEAGKIRRDAERYKAARALPGGSNIV
jgi:hypothetical protein